MVGHSQQRFMICKSALTGLTALHDNTWIFRLQDSSVWDFLHQSFQHYQPKYSYIQVGILQSGWVGNKIIRRQVG